jgi:uncharacterized protein DUF3800
MRYRMFIDDTGNVHNTTSNHPQARFAGITGVIFGWDYLHDVFEPGFLKLKERHFGLDKITGRPPILHLRKMKKAQEQFNCLTNETNRLRWQSGCFSMYRRAAYHVITVGVDKVAFYAKYPQWQGRFYEMLVGDAIERYFYFLRFRGVGDVMAEAINEDRDHELERLYRRFYDHGTDHISANLLRPVLTSAEIKIKPKDSDVQGLQMADLLASTCFAHQKRLHAGGAHYDSFAMEVAELMETEKFYRNPQGDPNGYGRVWRP